MEESGQPQAGKPAKKKKPASKERKFLTDLEERFLCAYKVCGFVKPAAMRVGISFHQAYHIKQKPLAKAFLETLTAERLDTAKKELAQKFVLDVQFFDEIMHDSLRNHKTHKYRGDEALVENLRTCAERLELIKKPVQGSRFGVQVNTSGSPVTANATAFEVYEAQWLREKKASWAKELEQKHEQSFLTADSGN